MVRRSTLGDLFGENQSTTVIEDSLINASSHLDTSTIGKTKESFGTYVKRKAPKIILYRHVLELIAVLQRVADGELTRVMIQMPPRHGKTEIVSKLFSAYWLEQFPDEWVGLTSYVEGLSFPISQSVQDYYTSDPNNPPLRNSAIRHWETAHGGGMWAAGIGGPITGKGFNLGVIDDPIKNAEEAESPATGARNWNWYRSTFYSREAPSHTAIIIVQTRWPGPADMIGQLLNEEGGEDEDHEHWYIVDFPARRGEAGSLTPDDGTGTLSIPSSVRVHPDWREPESDEPLCPGRYNQKKLNKIKRINGPYYWNALYLQRPHDKEGTEFKRAWFPTVDRAELPSLNFAVHPVIRYWDLAGTEGGGDFTAGLKYVMLAPDNFVVLDLKYGQWSGRERDLIIRQTAREDGLGTAIWSQQDPASAGKDAARAFKVLLMGFNVHTELATGEKSVRGRPVASAAESGFIRIVKAPWNKAFYDEIVTLWTGRHDDIGDTLAGAHNKITNRRFRRRSSRQQMTSNGKGHYGV